MCADGNLFRLHRLGHLADQIDHQQPVFKVGGFDPDIISQLEAALEPALGDANVEELAGGGFVALPALNNQQVLLRGNLDIGGLETGHSHRDTVGIIAALLDVERRIVVTAAQTALIFQQIEQAVEAHHGAAIGSEIKTIHGKILTLSN